VKSFFHFFGLFFRSELKKHIDIIALSALMLSILTAVMVSMASYKSKVFNEIDQKPDFILKNSLSNGSMVPLDWMDKLYEIRGVSDIAPRLFVDFNGFKLLGIDFLEDNPNQNLSKLINSINLKEFLSKNYLLAKKNSLKSSQIKIKNQIFKLYPLSKEQEALIPQNTLILPLDKLQMLFNLDENFVTDIAFNVPNDDEWTMVEDKVNSLSFSSLAVNKKDMKKAYSQMFNFKGGFFLVLYLIVMAIFALILYSRYSQFQSYDKRVVGILRGVGWSIRDILIFKFLESALVVGISFILGVLGGYLILSFDSKLVGKIFFDDFKVAAIFDGATIFSILLIYSVIFFASVLIPVWKVAITQPKEAMN